MHMADIHLGAPTRGVRGLSPEWAARVQRAIGEAYDRAVGAALQRKVDFVVMAGDVFDTSRASYGDYLRFFEGLEKLDAAGIPVFLVAGNHDPFTSWEKDVGRLPASARLLGAKGPEFALVRREGKPVCLVGGRSYYNQTWPEDEGIADGIFRTAAIKALRDKGEADAAEAPFMVGIVHTGLDVDLKKAPVELEKLLAADVDYWACGHLHKRYVLPNEATPRVVFPGCLQGRDLKESGERGCFLVQLEDGAPPELELVPTASVAYASVTVDVGGCRTLADAVRLVSAELFHVNGKVRCDDMVVRVTLAGKTELHGFLQRKGVIDDLRKQINDAYPSFFCDALADRTRPADRGGAGAFHRIAQGVVKEELGREDVLINYVQSEFVERGIAVPASLSRRVGEFGASAEDLVFELLREEGDR